MLLPHSALNYTPLPCDIYSSADRSHSSHGTSASCQAIRAIPCNFAVQRQMQALRTAELNYDAKSAAKLLADGFLLTSTDGNLYTKEEFLQLIGDKSNPLELCEYGEMEVRTYDTTAVVFAQVHEKGFLGGKPYELNGRPTFTWVKQEGDWVCVAAHD